MHSVIIVCDDGQLKRRWQQLFNRTVPEPSSRIELPKYIKLAKQVENKIWRPNSLNSQFSELSGCFLSEQIEQFDSKLCKCPLTWRGPKSNSGIRTVCVLLKPSKSQCLQTVIRTLSPELLDLNEFRLFVCAFAVKHCRDVASAPRSLSLSLSDRGPGWPV